MGHHTVDERILIAARPDTGVVVAHAIIDAERPTARERGRRMCGNYSGEQQCGER
jgi:hypothetical protein